MSYLSVYSHKKASKIQTRKLIQFHTQKYTGLQLTASVETETETYKYIFLITQKCITVHNHRKVKLTNYDMILHITKVMLTN